MAARREDSTAIHGKRTGYSKVVSSEDKWSCNDLPQVPPEWLQLPAILPSITAMLEGRKHDMRCKAQALLIAHGDTTLPRGYALHAKPTPFGEGGNFTAETELLPQHMVASSVLGTRRRTALMAHRGSLGIPLSTARTPAAGYTEMSLSDSGIASPYAGHVHGLDADEPCILPTGKIKVCMCSSTRYILLQFYSNY